MNKKFYLVGMFAASMLLVSCGETSEKEEDTKSEPTEQNDESENEEGEDQEETKTEFGSKKVDVSKAISTEEMLANFEGKTEMEATFKGEINEVCSKMGCWININKGDGETFMVRFKDHFTIPTETEVGTVAYLTGTAIQDTIPVDEQRHYLEDANAPQEEIDAITEDKFEMTFIADGIKLEE
ncbi:MAG: DUF4920 domain-containing protein [Brumimicrobium sp.]